ncbi:MAG: hypothetical protein R6V75_06845, partial [Bacteroidales bacterium]
PRERDYVYVGSFYAFSIFIGMGVLYFFDLLKNKLKPHLAALISTTVALVLVPGILASENWDDHDRSGRRTAHNFAYNYLVGLDEHALIFTNGDNDTFPLWYIQEVEGVRTDVRVCCMPFLPQDWYIDQLKRTYYESKALPLSMEFEQYRQGKRGMVPILDRVKRPADLKQVIEFALSDDPAAMVPSTTGRQFNYLPAATFVLPVDREKVVANGTVSPERAAQVDTAIVWTMLRQGQEQGNVYKDELVMLDLLAHNEWERPIYYTTPGQSGSVKLDNYLELQGLSYRLVPIQGERQSSMTGNVNTTILYDNLMNKFRYTNFNNPKVYQDENCRRMMQNLKNNFNRLAGTLINEGQTARAVEVLNKLEEVMPKAIMGYTYLDVDNVDLWYQAGDRGKGLETAKFVFDHVRDNMNYFLSLPSRFVLAMNQDIQFAFAYELQPLLQILENHGEEDLFKEVESKYNDYYNRYMAKTGGGGPR